MYTYVRLNDEASSIVETLIPYEERDRLATNVQAVVTSVETRISFIAYQDELAVGILQADFTKAENSVYFHTLYVTPEHRQQHIASALLAKGIEEMKKEKASICTFIYTKNDPNAPIVEKLLAEWQGTRPFMKRCYFDYTFDAPWMHLNYRYPCGYEEFPWKDLKESDRVDIKNKITQGRIPQALSPFRKEDSIESLNSLGLRFQGEVVGWMITHRMDADTVCYSNLFIEKPLQKRGIAMTLLIHSIRLHLLSPTKKFALIEIPYLLVDSSWIHLVNKRLVPYTVRTTNLVQAWCQLNYT
ncbi:MAG: GNAT family N-acetyltransferase [Parachlamydiaceae bacterium]